MLELFQVVEQPAALDKARSILAAGHEGLHVNLRHPSYGQTLLNQALFSGSIAMVQLLLDHGADPNQGDMMDSQTPLDHMREFLSDDNTGEATEEEKEIIALLKKYGGKESNFNQWMRANSEEDQAYYYNKVMTEGDQDSLHSDDE